MRAGQRGERGRGVGEAERLRPRHHEGPILRQLQDPAACPGPERPALRVRRADEDVPVGFGPRGGGDRDDPLPVLDQSQRDVTGLVTADRVQSRRDALGSDRPDPVQQTRPVLDGRPAKAPDDVEAGRAGGATTCTPSRRACWSTLTPTAPAAPCSRTASSSRAPEMCSKSAAVVPTSIRLAASGKVSDAGFANTLAPAPYLGQALSSISMGSLTPEGG